MATAVLINSETFGYLTEEQVLTWRAITYADPCAYIKFSEYSMYNMQPSNTLTFDQIRESINDRMIKYKTQGLLRPCESVFVMIDSSTLGEKNLEDAIASLCLKHNLFNNNIIIVASQINKTENVYKFRNVAKYPRVNFNVLDRNIALLDGRVPFQMKNVIVFNTDIAFDNKMLFVEEHYFLQQHGTWQFKDRNEINDSAQLRMLVSLNQMFSKRCFLISRDRGLINKTQKDCPACGFFF